MTQALLIDSNGSNKKGKKINNTSDINIDQ